MTLPSEDRFARLFAPPLLPRPDVATLDDQGILRWKWFRHLRKFGKIVEEAGARQRPPELQSPPPDLCFRFARLASGSDERIRRFAQRWGPLGIADIAEEHINDWRHYATLAGALLRFAGEQASGGGGRDEDWVLICQSTVAKDLDRSDLKVAEQGAISANAVNTLFAKARGHRILDIVDDELQVQPGASNLLGVLVTQIAHVMARSDELAVCANCKKLFRVKRRLSRGSRRYCPRCRRAKVPQRDASRDWRRRVSLKAK